MQKIKLLFLAGLFVSSQVFGIRVPVNEQWEPAGPNTPVTSCKYVDKCATVVTDGGEQKIRVYEGTGDDDPLSDYMDVVLSGGGADLPADCNDDQALTASGGALVCKEVASGGGSPFANRLSIDVPTTAVQTPPAQGATFKGLFSESVTSFGGSAYGSFHTPTARVKDLIIEGKLVPFIIEYRGSSNDFFEIIIKDADKDLFPEEFTITFNDTELSFNKTDDVTTRRSVNGEMGLALKITDDFDEPTADTQLVFDGEFPEFSVELNLDDISVGQASDIDDDYSFLLIRGFNNILSVPLPSNAIYNLSGVQYKVILSEGVSAYGDPFVSVSAITNRVKDLLINSRDVPFVLIVQETDPSSSFIEIAIRDSDKELFPDNFTLRFNDTDYQFDKSNNAVGRDLNGVAGFRIDLRNLTLDIPTSDTTLTFSGDNFVEGKAVVERIPYDGTKERINNTDKLEVAEITGKTGDNRSHVTFNSKIIVNHGVEVDGRTGSVGEIWCKDSNNALKWLSPEDCGITGGSSITLPADCASGEFLVTQSGALVCKNVNTPIPNRLRFDLPVGAIHVYTPPNPANDGFAVIISEGVTSGTILTTYGNFTDSLKVKDFRISDKNVPFAILFDRDNNPNFIRLLFEEEDLELFPDVFEIEFYGNRHSFSKANFTNFSSATINGETTYSARVVETIGTYHDAVSLHATTGAFATQYAINTDNVFPEDFDETKDINMRGVIDFHNGIKINDVVGTAGQGPVIDADGNLSWGTSTYTLPPRLAEFQPHIDVTTEQVKDFLDVNLSTTSPVGEYSTSEVFANTSYGNSPDAGLGFYDFSDDSMAIPKDIYDRDIKANCTSGSCVSEIVVINKSNNASSEHPVNTFAIRTTHNSNGWTNGVKTINGREIVFISFLGFGGISQGGHYQIKLKKTANVFVEWLPRVPAEVFLSGVRTEGYQDATNLDLSTYVNGGIYQLDPTKTYTNAPEPKVITQNKVSFAITADSVQTAGTSRLIYSKGVTQYRSNTFNSGNVALSVTDANRPDDLIINGRTVPFVLEGSTVGTGEIIFSVRATDKDLFPSSYTISLAGETGNYSKPVDTTSDDIKLNNEKLSSHSHNTQASSNVTDFFAAGTLFFDGDFKVLKEDLVIDGTLYVTTTFTDKLITGVTQFLVTRNEAVYKRTDSSAGQFGRPMSGPWKELAGQHKEGVRHVTKLPPPTAGNEGDIVYLESSDKNYNSSTYINIRGVYKNLEMLFPNIINYDKDDNLQAGAGSAENRAKKFLFSKDVTSISSTVVTFAATKKKSVMRQGVQTSEGTVPFVIRFADAQLEFMANGLDTRARIDIHLFNDTTDVYGTVTNANITPDVTSINGTTVEFHGRVNNANIGDVIATDFKMAVLSNSINLFESDIPRVHNFPSSPENNDEVYLLSDVITQGQCTITNGKSGTTVGYNHAVTNTFGSIAPSSCGTDIVLFETYQNPLQTAVYFKSGFLSTGKLLTRFKAESTMGNTTYPYDLAMHKTGTQTVGSTVYDRYIITRNDGGNFSGAIFREGFSVTFIFDTDDLSNPVYPAAKTYERYHVYKYNATSMEWVQE